MKKLFSALFIVMMIALACTMVAGAENYTPDADGLYNIEYAVEAEDGTQFGMVVIEATGDEAFALDEATIRYIDQVGAEDGAIAFDAFAPMDLKNEGTYKVYIGGGDLDEATFIGTLSTDIPAAPSVKSVTIDQAAPTVEEGKTVALTATVVDADAEYTLAWASDNTAVATVDAATGVVTGVKEGTANITVTAAEGVTATVAVTVTAASAPSTKKGDINGDGRINSKDVLYLLDYTFDDSIEVFANTDVNGDNRTNSKDVLYLLDYTFDDSIELH